MISFGTVLDRHKGVGQGFDFLRLFLAVSIVLFHTLILTGNGWILETPIWMVEYALVPMFFALSGFLVTASGQRLSLGNFLINRGLRIVPALAVDIVIAAFIIGPLVTTLGLGAYFTDQVFLEYFLNIFGYIHYELPGVFKTGIYAANDSTKVNGALWTVPYEIICYIIISILILLKWLGEGRKVLSLTLLVIVIGLVLHATQATESMGAVSGKVISNMFIRRQSQVVTAFLFGVVAYQYRYAIPYNAKIFALAVGTCVGAAFVLNHSELEIPEGRIILLPAIAYTTLFIGLTKIRIPELFKKGDYSYGIYLYHSPLLQVMIGIFPGLAAVRLYGAGFIFLATLPFIVLLACFSWHVVEKPVLALRKKFTFVARARGVLKGVSA